MKQLEILSALTRWANATPDEILDSPAFAMPCRIGEEQALLRPAAVEPAASCSLALSVTFGDEPHELRFSRSARFPELDRIWDSRAEAIAFYLEGMMNCEGAECDRYTNIYLALISGAKVCKDEPDNE